MQKLIGASMILLATSGAGMIYGLEQQCYLEKLIYIRHIVYMLKGELDYANIPLGEVFGRVAVRVKEHVIQLKELGTYLGKMDSVSESRNLQLYIERLELEIEKARSGLASKKRIGNCLGVMGGLFLIVIFI